MPTMKSPADKADEFWALHQHEDAFVIPNPWDAGSARMLAGMGFKALATSSAASAGTLGRQDYELKRDEALSMARQIVEAVDVPVSADLENGFGDSPEERKSLPDRILHYSFSNRRRDNHV